jgi:hypothetical protein
MESQYLYTVHGTHKNGAWVNDPIKFMQPVPNIRSTYSLSAASGLIIRAQVAAVSTMADFQLLLKLLHAAGNLARPAYAALKFTDLIRDAAMTSASMSHVGWYCWASSKDSELCNSITGSLHLADVLPRLRTPYYLHKKVQAVMII